MSAAVLDRNVVVVDFSPGARPRAPRDPRDRQLDDDDPETVRRRLRSSRVVPGVVASTACEKHDAAVGEPCHRAPVAICGERLARSLAAAVPSALAEPGADPEDWLHRRAERDRTRTHLRHENRHQIGRR